MTKENLEKHSKFPNKREFKICKLFLLISIKQEVNMKKLIEGRDYSINEYITKNNECESEKF